VPRIFISLNPMPLFIKKTYLFCNSMNISNEKNYPHLLQKLPLYHLRRAKFTRKSGHIKIKAFQEGDLRLQKMKFAITSL
jgi:hypothetical protein|tara:strand:+ start:255 stop:494 length:240 start_codon:yes stop_codon:yes gene_type:complete